MTDTQAGRTPNSEELREAEERTRRRFLALEREAESLRSRVRILGIGLLATLILGAVGAFSVGLPWVRSRTSDVEVLTAQRIILQDAEGNMRGEWRVDEDGNSRLGILDRAGRVRLSMTVLSGGSPGMALVNQNGRRRAVLGLLPDESTNLAFTDAAGVPRAVLGVSPRDAAQLVFADAGGVSRIALGLDATGMGNIILPGDSLSEGIEEGGGGF